MKHIATVALMASLAVAGVYAQERPVNAQERPVKMTFSGTNVATTINLKPNTVTDERARSGQERYVWGIYIP